MINIITSWKRTKMGGVGAAQTPRHRQTDTHAHAHMRTHLSCSCSQRDPVKMCVKSCHSFAQSPSDLSPKAKAFTEATGLPCSAPSLSLSGLVCCQAPLSPGLSGAPERPGTSLPWGLGVATPSAWNASSPDVRLLGLSPLLPVFAQMPSCW